MTTNDPKQHLKYYCNKKQKIFRLARSIDRFSYINLHAEDKARQPRLDRKNSVVTSSTFLCLAFKPLATMSASRIEYSEKYADDANEYR
jgi:23S rRNA A2030 N6-methylase RlmJ